MANPKKRELLGPRRVAVLLPTGTRGHEILLGVLRYDQTGPRWHVREQIIEERNVETALAWNPDGIIISAYSEPIIEQLAARAIPTVNVSSRVSDRRPPSVLPDNRAIGRMAAEHFLARGFRRFAVLTDDGSATTDDRIAGFGQRLAAAGFSADVMRIADEDGIFMGWELIDGRRPNDPLMRWVQSLPRPVAVFADDNRGPILSHLCQRIGLAVPEQVAILGVDNDEIKCLQAYPPMSSIDVPHEKLGHEAAVLLEHLMDGGEAPAEPIRIQPTGVVVRASTDITAIEDEHVAAAVRFINVNAHRRIRVADVEAAVTSVGPRALRSRFRKLMGRSVLDEIHRVCLERAKMILASGNQALPKVAREAGFRDNQHMWMIFKKLTGTSPLRYRRAQRT